MPSSILSPIAPSRSKEDLFHALNWSESNEAHRHLYMLMMEEANHGRERAIHREHLLHGYQATTHVTETSKHIEIQEIFRTASPATRSVYNLGVRYDGENWENWIIRWTLWHSFRYRDDRNRNRYSANYYPCGDAAAAQHAAYAPHAYYAQTAHTGTSYYDPVRDT
ncbi:hypothetical protein P152DRAFT_487732 [Eremomyces bilateralis CBS 781.70]|uniref:Uncharacterized protein n=1 Tax=Eremomyces bilateralis CBS 781.70 TaxID=1392243 RepID=A0A6G1G2H2_9PEZI|nr:uncharacterized protein P152DRAFT_487732 [Eremomyces bilateralis CBS 781.70]KAF1812243.1 hypothetical protein P152DRAFT_487732 [Eremomyces bilateralis CBS 781.70]